MTWVVWVILTIGFLLAFIGLNILSNHVEFECTEIEDVCYKTVCSFWGCKSVEVDLDSPTCERRKEDVCKDWRIK